MTLRFALGVFTERILDYVLSCRCQVVGNSEFFGGVMYRSHAVVVTGAAVGGLDEQNLRFSARGDGFW